MYEAYFISCPTVVSSDQESELNDTISKMTATEKWHDLRTVWIIMVAVIIVFIAEYTIN